MRLFEAILDANHRAVAGDLSAGIHVADYVQELPLVALTCIDPRLNRLFPGVLALPEDQFIWLRNAGNIITGPISSTMRSLALACAVKGGREIAVIGHTDCKVRHTTIAQLIEGFKALGIERPQLPENLTEYFGVFSSERQNVIGGVDQIRQSPLIGARIPVHGLMVDIQSGRLEWVVNGYDVLARPSAAADHLRLPTLGGIMGDLATGAGFNFGEMKFPESKIGEAAKAAFQSLAAPGPVTAHSPPPAPTPVPPALPPLPSRPRAVPIPPPIQLHVGGRDRKKSS
jgi:carbonic anhydrase